MSRLVTIGQAAQELGVSSRTLRRYEEQGIIAPVRTAGAQRRYREEDIAALLTSRAGAAPTAATIRRPRDLDAELLETPRPRELAPLAPWERRVRKERAELEVTKLRFERDDLLAARRATAAEVARANQESARAAEREIEARELAAEQRAAADQARAVEANRLGQMRSLAELRLAFARVPDELSGRIKRDLIRFVTTERFPPELSTSTAQAQIYAKLDEWMAPGLAEQEEARERQRQSSVRKSLRESGSMRAWRKTLAWDPRAKERARSEIDQALERQVRSTWTSQDVDDLVDEMLDEWE